MPSLLGASQAWLDFQNQLANPPLGLPQAPGAAPAPAPVMPQMAAAQPAIPPWMFAPPQPGRNPTHPSEDANSFYQPEDISMLTPEQVETRAKWANRIGNALRYAPSPIGQGLGYAARDHFRDLATLETDRWGDRVPGADIVWDARGAGSRAGNVGAVQDRIGNLIEVVPLYTASPSLLGDQRALEGGMSYDSHNEPWSDGGGVFQDQDPLGGYR